MGRRKKFNMFKADSWVNLIKGLAGTSDATSNTYFGDVHVLNDDELSRAWAGSGLGKKIVSRPADDMTRNWFTIKKDTDGKILDELKRLEAQTEITNAIKWARLYRGSIIVMGLNDGQELEKPVGKNVQSIDWLKVYPASRIPVYSQDIVSDHKSKYFEDVEWFRIETRRGKTIKVHRSRCLVFKGDPLPDTMDTLGDQYLYWGTSILQSIWTDVTNYGGISQSIVNLMYEAVIGKYKLAGLEEQLAGGNTKAVYDRMEIINAGKSIINAVILGKDDDYIRDSADLTGIPLIMDRFMINIAASAEIPVTILFGRSPAGENSTGEADLRSYYDMVASKQETWMTPPLQILVNYINGYIKAVKEDKAIIEYNSVWEMTDKEKVEMREIQSKTDVAYINTAALTPEEVRKSRWGGDSYSIETSLIEGALKKFPANEEPDVPVPGSGEEE